MSEPEQHDLLNDPELAAAIMAEKLRRPEMFISNFEDDSSGVASETDPGEITLPFPAVGPTPNLTGAERTAAVRLLKAAEDGIEPAVREILSAHPRLVNVRDGDMYSPLHRAAYNNHPRIVAFLLENGGDINSRTEDGWTPLHSAARWAALDAARVLLNEGNADVNAATNGKLTPLHISIASGEEGAVEMTKMLLMHPNINVRAVSNAGEAPFDLAKRTSKEMVDLFANIIPDNN